MPHNIFSTIIAYIVLYFKQIYVLNLIKNYYCLDKLLPDISFAKAEELTPFETIVVTLVRQHLFVLSRQDNEQVTKTMFSAHEHAGMIYGLFQISLFIQKYPRTRIFFPAFYKKQDLKLIKTLRNHYEIYSTNSSSK